MKEQTIADLVRTLFYILGAVALWITWWYSLRMYMTKKLDNENELALAKEETLRIQAKETSVGVTAIATQTQKNLEIESRLIKIQQELRETDKKRSDEIGKLADNLREFTFNALKIFNINQK